jgi:hypothetical protein
MNRIDGRRVLSDDKRLAPPNVAWHEAYERWLHSTMKAAEELKTLEGYDKAEDLGDYVDTIDTLLSFAPHSRDDIHSRIMEEVYKG